MYTANPHSGLAEYNSWVHLPDSTVIVENVNNNVDPSNKYAKLVYIANSLSVGAPDPTSTIIEETLLNAVTSTGASTEQEVSIYRYLTFHIVSAGVTSGGTVVIQTSLDNVNWVDKASLSITTNTTHEVNINACIKYVRANLTARTDGTYTVNMIGSC